LFPGQGSQFVGMAKDLYHSNPEVKALYQRANEIMQLDLARICFEGPEEALKQTDITQPAIFVHSIAVFDLIKNNIPLPSAVAGHSLGEYSALVAAAALSFDDGLKLVKTRGELMQKSGRDKPGTMAAIIGLDSGIIDQICRNVNDNGIVCAANYNSPGQVVISGDIKAVRQAMALAKDKGARKVIELTVSGAFHSPLMEGAAAGLFEALQSTEIKKTVIPIYSNVEATATTDSAKIRELLYKQLTHPVRWEEIIHHMVKDGVNKFYEIGPGKVLSGLNRRIEKDFDCTAIGTESDIIALGS
jgi:[acyl-carrier-protein] S-malonyltransferase